MISNLDRHAGRGVVSPSEAGEEVRWSMGVERARPRRAGTLTWLAEGLGGRKPLTDGFRDRACGFNLLSILVAGRKQEEGEALHGASRPRERAASRAWRPVVMLVGSRREAAPA